MAEIRGRFAGQAQIPREQKFAELLTGWLDPHGLWSAAPDAPFRAALRERTQVLLAELSRPADSGDACVAAQALGGVLSKWVLELRGVFDRAALPTARPVSRQRAIASAMASVFQDDPVTERAYTLARILGERLSSFEQAYPQEGGALLSAARGRYFPDIDATAWSEVVLAAAVRAYVPLVDPHGDWAPFEEEWSLYAEDPGLDGDPRLWSEITRTAVGVRILGNPLPPLDTGDLVLSVDGIRTAGMPLEQAEQLGRLEPGPSRHRRLELLRHGRHEVETVSVDFTGEADPAEADSELETENVSFGDKTALIVRIADVDDGLGPALARALLDLNPAEVAGVLLDLRGNGGGSADAAAETLGLFLPGAPLFPLSARGRLVEVVRAGSPANELRYQGPVATLVDGYTASAAEMIAGALSAYGRGPMVGARTFGKGCIQEYADDHTGKGVLRLTTLLFALPDGSPVQRLGLSPHIVLPIEPAREHESDLAGSLPEYRGPDVRDRHLGTSEPWPPHRGRVGPCRDRAVCAALRRLGVSEVASRPKLKRRLTSRAVSGSGFARP